MRPGGFEPLAFRVGELRQDGIDRRRNVKFVGSVQLSPKREKAHCWLSQQAFRHFTVRLHSSGQMVVKIADTQHAGTPQKDFADEGGATFRRTFHL